jgi:hypothetical protein
LVGNDRVREKPNELAGLVQQKLSDFRRIAHPAGRW